MNMQQKPKVRATIMLDEEAKQIVQEHLAKLGMSFSGFLNAILCEFAKEIQGQPMMLKKPVQELTIKEFGELASYWIQKASE